MGVDADASVVRFYVAAMTMTMAMAMVLGASYSVGNALRITTTEQAEHPSVVAPTSRSLYICTRV